MTDRPAGAADSSDAARQPRAAVFLDRDGVIIEDSPDYITSVEQVRLLPRAAEAIRLLNQARIPVVVVTNQAAVARGLITETILAAINNRVRSLLHVAAGATIDALYYCPFHPDGTVERYAMASRNRKPEPGMLLDAAADLHLDLEKCVMVGDKASDIEAGRRAGCRSVLIAPAVRDEGRHIDGDGATHVAVDLMDAVRWVLSAMAREQDC